MPRQNNPVSNRPKPVGLRAREGFWHYRFKHNNQEYSGNTGLAAIKQNVNDALQVRALERKRIMGGDTLPIEIYPFSKASAEFLDWCEGEYVSHPNTSLRIKTSFASLRRFFRSEPVVNIQEGSIENFKTYRRTSHIKEITLRHDLHSLSLFFQYAKKRKWCMENPVRNIAIPSDKDAVRMYILSGEEQIRYLAAARQISTDLYDLSVIMLLQGCRPEEVMTMERANVDLARRTFKIAKGKSSAAKRTLKMRPAVYSILTKRLQEPAGRWVFPSTRKPGLPITKLNNPHNLACERTNLDIVLYDHRHTFATRMALDGCPLPNLASILGHGNLRSIQKYVHPAQENLDDSMDRHGADLAKVDDPSALRPPAKSTASRYGHY